MRYAKWMRAFYSGLTIVFEILAFPFRVLYGIIEFIDTLKK